MILCLFQAEHGPDSQVVLVISGDGVDVASIEKEISKQCQSLPRKEFALKALSHSFIVFVSDMFEVRNQLLYLLHMLHFLFSSMIELLEITGVLSRLIRDNPNHSGYYY